MAGPLFPVFVHDRKLHVAAHDHDLAVRVGQSACVFKHNLTGMGGFKERLLATLGNAADVEGPHRQLRTRLTDRLRRDDPHRFARIDPCAPRKVTAVARGANAFFGLTRQWRTNTHRRNCMLINSIGHPLVNQRTMRNDHFIRTWLQHIFGRNPAQHALCQGRHDLTIVNRRNSRDGVFGAAINHAHDTVLCHVDQTAGQITRVRRFQSGVRQTFPRAVGRVEVLKNRQTFFKVRDNRRLDDIAVRLGHQAAHPAELLHLCDRATRTRVRHHVDGVWFHLHASVVCFAGRNGAHHRVCDFVVTLGPSVDDFVVLLTLGDQAVHVLLFEILHQLAGFIHNGPFGIGDKHVILAKRNACLEGFAEAHGHDVVTENHGLFLTAVAVNRVNNLLHFFLPQQAVHKREWRLVVERQKRAQTDPARCCLKALHDLLAVCIDLRQTRRDLGVQVHNAQIQRVLDLFDGAEDHAFARHTCPLQRGVVEAQNHVLRRDDDRRTVGGRQHVVRRHHQDARFQLRLKA